MIKFQSEKSQSNLQWMVGEFTPQFTHNPAEFLSAEELAYLAQLTHGKRQNEFLQTRFLLKQKLSEILNKPAAQIHFFKTGEGKPVLNEGGVDFNISHSHGVYALALSTRGQVGIDIEKLRDSKTLAAVAKRFFTSQEAEKIAAELDPEKQTLMFTKIWAGKEALIKAMASGVLKSAGEILLDTQTWQIKKLPESFGELHLWELTYLETIPGYVCCVAFKQGDHKD